MAMGGSGKGAGERWGRLAGELAVFDAVGAVGFLAFALLEIFEVGGVVAVVVNDFAVALEGEDVGGDAVEEPAVVGNHHGAAGEAFEAFFEGADGVYVEIVGGFVEEDEVGPAFEQAGEVDAVAFAAGEHADFLLLIGPGEAELGAVGTGVYLAAGHTDDLFAAADGLVDGLGVGQGVARLVHVGDEYGVADAQGAGIGFFGTGDEAEEGGLARAVGADDADQAAGWKGEAEVFEEDFFAVGFGHAFELDHELAEARALGENKFEFAVLLGGDGAADHFFVGADAGLGFGVAGLGTLANPFEFADHGFLAFVLGALLGGEAGGFLFEPAGVVALPGDAVAVGEFEDPLGDVVEEVAVVRDGDDGALVAGEVLFEPVDGFGVEMVGGLVEQEDGGLLEQQAGEGDAATFAAGEGVHESFGCGAAKGIHGHFDLGSDVPSAKAFDLGLELGLIFADGVASFVGIGGGQIVP